MTGKELDRAVHQQLRTLSKENAEGVAQHLVMVAATLEADNLEAALAHAETAVRRAGRVPAAREALGMVAYRLGDFARALTEFRTVRRLSGSSHLLPLMVDCERGLGPAEQHAPEEQQLHRRQQQSADRIDVLEGIEREAPGRLGGAIALGHPGGATGARLVLTALQQLKADGGKRALVSLCIGGGQGGAAWLETL